MTVSDSIHALLAIAMVLTLASLLVPLADRLRLPHTVLLAIAGMGLGFLGTYINAQGHDFGPIADIFTELDRLEVATDIFLPLFLPPLLFTAGLTIDVRRLFDEVFAVLLLAIVAVLVCIAVVAGAVHLATGMDIAVCLLLGAVVSTTDPAAVIGIFREVGAPKRLSILAEGESLLNDAVAIAAFGFFITFVLRQGGDPDVVRSVSGDVTNPLVAFAREFLGGLVFGFGLARVAMLILPRLGESDAAIASVTVSLAYAAYVLADHYLHVSGVIAVVVAALTVAAYGPTHLHPRRWTALKQLWTQLDFWSNCLIFILASMLAATVLPKISWLYVVALAAVALGAFVARIIVVFGMLPVLEMGRLVEPVDRRYKVILVWGGLRGAVTIVLAMVAASDGRLSDDVREFAAVLATLFVLFTLFVNATTLGVVMRILGLDKLTRLELALRDRVLALSRINVTHHMQQIIREHNARVEGIDADPLSAGDESIDAAPAELALDPEERLTVGLVTLCTQERELYLDQFEQQTLSRRMVATLMARADRLVDAVRARGAEGYQETIRAFALPDGTFRLALWLQRRLGIDRLLTKRLADRFEILMVQQDVLAELALFNVHSIGDLLGADTEQRLGEVIGDRQGLVALALHALVLQYPGYAESIRDRQLERAAIRLEAAEYARRLRESIIGREVYADLRRRLNKRRDAIADRPALHLGLELQAMIARVPLFAGLDKAGLTALSRRLRAVVALPNEKIIESGSRPDAMYFIAAGEVTVEYDGGSAQLREGDFFGEMGLLDNKPRNADVISDGYSHLLALSKGDFNRLLAQRPEIRTAIAAVAAQRMAAPTPTGT
ncbi:MAG: cation:proton antiporter [Proteobacteria bacterium]|nr:cation:proton antiporter [Pseudomonadota bacterium]